LSPNDIFPPYRNRSFFGSYYCFVYSTLFFSVETPAVVSDAGVAVATFSSTHQFVGSNWAPRKDCEGKQTSSNDRIYLNDSLSTLSHILTQAFITKNLVARSTKYSPAKYSGRKADGYKLCM